MGKGEEGRKELSMYDGNREGAVCGRPAKSSHGKVAPFFCPPASLMSELSSMSSMGTAAASTVACAKRARALEPGERPRSSRAS
eukprot:1004962-Pleurochrysis_carterae.AAC.10